ncbi:MAG: DUF2752 domain-containing protein [Verrucomicrobiales bacterium]|jgi:hypothetical protein|nr:DUF2752 domain-containing protein [Verrucomicrobiales bacterium]MDP4792824.1 DUF2752 domain-containing protein [Verrucomicrobiales bacterium]MDP4938865.1 DUF2752 domain-containing protein [Verrucomicrobiales bacterium]MDP5005894.1 DUF2752 domain-containing protein [Verrucomicrobiales bacterium]
MRSAGGKWAATVAALLVGLVLALYLRSVDISSPPRFLPRCGFHMVTGFHCPGCGNTRASHALLHGDVAGAMRQNALFVIALPFLLFWAGRSWLGWVYPHRLGLLPFQWRYSYSLGLIGLVVVFGVARNLPYAPFDRLAPVTITASRASAAPAGLLRDVQPPSEH